MPEQDGRSRGGGALGHLEWWIRKGRTMQDPSGVLRWLMMKGKVEEAKQVLCSTAGVNKKAIPSSCWTR